MTSNVAGLSAVLFALVVAASDAAAVEYRVVFQSNWSEATHPTAWVSTAHYSGLIGGTHNADVSFWQLGGLATPGIKNMAELGTQSTLAAEVNSAIATGDAFSVIQGSSAGLRPTPGQDSTTFQIDTAHQLVTLVTMIAPSPDWFVGVSGLELFQSNMWRNDVVVDLLPYDAGTDSGVALTSANLVTSPPQPIAYLGAPFTGTPTLGTFTFQLIPGLGDLNADGFVDVFDVNVVSENWGGGGPDGDANGDQIVDIFDVNVISSNWSPSESGAATGIAAVPEPATWASSAVAALLAVASVAVRHRRFSG